MATGLEDQRPLNGVLTALASDVLGFCSPPHEAEDPLETRSVSGCSLCSPCSQEALTGSDAERTRLGRGAKAALRTECTRSGQTAEGSWLRHLLPKASLETWGLYEGPRPRDRLGAKRGVRMERGPEFPCWNLAATDQPEGGSLRQQTRAQVAAFATRRERWVQGGEAGERPCGARPYSHQTTS